MPTAVAAAADLEELESWLRLARNLASIEAELLGHVLANPLRGVTLARDRFGVAPDWFEQGDLRLIYAAAEGVAPTMPSDRWECRIAVAEMAQRLLHHFGYWDETIVASGENFGMLWSSASLAWLFNQQPHAEFVPGVCRRLGETRARSRDANAHLRLCWRALRGSDPAVSPLQIAADLVRISRLTGVQVGVLLRSMEFSARTDGGAAA
jgi:hypothetical protein